jgi:cobalt/nickel transport system permease protein
MKKLILIVAAIMVAFAVLLPFASKTPDGLQTLTENSGSQQQPMWNGIMANYSVAFADPYVSTLVAGLFGTGMVLLASFALGATMTQKKKSEAPKKI